MYNGAESIVLCTEQSMLCSQHHMAVTSHMMCVHCAYIYSHTIPWDRHLLQLSDVQHVA